MTKIRKIIYEAKHYLLEIYSPAFPGKGRKCRVHEGNLEKNKEALNPSVIATKEIVATSFADAMVQANLWLKTYEKESHYAVRSRNV